MRVKVELSFTPGEPSDDQRFMVTVDEIVDEPTVVLELVKANGQLVCKAVTIRNSERTTSRDTRVPIERYVEAVKAHPALRDEHGGIYPRRRREMSDAFLSAVADAYRAAGNSVDGLDEKVDREFTGSDSTKYRWIKEARRRGLLEPKQ